MTNANAIDGAVDLSIGFLLMHEANGAIRCGLLVTDAAGVPKEFRATQPALRPTSVQRILYGNSLHREIARLCAMPMIEALEHTPKWVLVQSRELLCLDTEVLPVIVVAGHGEELEVETGHQDDDPVLESKDGSFRPVVLTFAESVTPDHQQRLREELAGAVSSGVVDLLEPFSRVGQALEVLDRQAPRG